MANIIDSLKINTSQGVFTLPYGQCEIAADTAAKTVLVTNFALEAGATVIVKFENANSAANATLDVNSTGAKPIYCNGTALAAKQYWAAGATLLFHYDGTAFNLVGHIPTKTSELTNDNGYTDNKGTVTQVKVNGETKSPDSTGLVDLGTISSGGGSYTFVEDPSKTYVKYKGTYFGTDDSAYCNGEATVDWGDGTVENYTSGDYLAHTYTDGNKYHLIAISGNIDWGHHPFYANRYVEEIIFTNTLNSDYTTENGELDSVCFGCDNLKIVKMQAATPPRLNEYCFYDARSLEKIIVPKSASSAYKASWSNLADKIVYLTDSSDLPSGDSSLVLDDLQVDGRAVFFGEVLVDGSNCTFLDTTVELSGGAAELKLQDSIGEPGQVVTVGDDGLPIWEYPPSGGGGMPIYIKANTGVKGTGDYNINVTILSGINELRVGDRIQVCTVSSSVWHRRDGTIRRRKRLRCIEYYEVSDLDIEKGRHTYSIDTHSYNTYPDDTWRLYKRSGTKTGSYLRRPVSVRILRCYNNDWNNEGRIRTILSNTVQLGTSANAVIPL